MATMHIPDNFLSTPVWATLDCVAAPAVAVVSRRARSSAELSQTSLLGVLGAFVFAAQMVNFPVGVGTSGHLVGGTLLACIVGPWAAALVMTSILLIQALVFQDGGILALGANILNMALIGVLVGYLPARLLSGGRWRNTGVFLGGTCSVLISGVLALSELLISGIRLSAAMIEVSLLVFVVNALVEGAITVSALQAIERIRPGISILGPAPAAYVSQKSKARRLLAITISAAVLLVFCGVIVASKLPDGLEHLALRLGVPYMHPILQSPFGDYYVRQFGRNWPSQATAGLLGITCIYFVCATASHLLGRARRSYSQQLRGLYQLRQAALARFSTQRSPVHDADARLKLLLMLAFLVSLALLGKPSALQITLCLAYLLCISVLAGLPWAGILKQALVVVPFVGFFALIIYVSGDLQRAVFILIKAYLSTLAVLICAACTPLPQLMQAARSLHTPGFLLDVTQIVYRYLFVLAGEFQSIRTSFLARAGRAGPRSFRSASSIVAVLFGRAYRRASAVDMAMVSRGFCGILPTPPSRALRLKDLAILLLGIAALLLVRIA